MGHTMKEIQMSWESKAKDFLIGRKVVAVRYLNEEEVEHIGWYGGKSLVIQFDDGSWMFPSADDEGNGPGALFTSSDDIPTIPVMP